MREILFRGKQCENKKWIIGYLSSKHTITITTPCGHTDEIVICADTVGQYTGMMDKTGNRIFEGDILSIWNESHDVVVFEDGAFILEDTAIPMRFANKFEVIGNIADNPELLEK